MPFSKSLIEALSAAALALALSVAALAVGLVAASANPAHAAQVTINADLGQRIVPAAGGKVYLHIGLKALRQAPEGNRTPVNVAIVLDRSGSMKGERLAYAKEAAREAISRLSADDYVSIIAYNHGVQVLADARRVGSHSALEDAIDGLTAEGRTALYAGVVEGGRQLETFLSDRRVNRVILMSDGLANVGPSSPADLAKLGQKLGAKGVSVTTIGLGLSYNEDLMQRLALASDGNHAFAEKPGDLVKIFNSEFGDTLSIAAQDIEIIIECHEGYRPKRVLGRSADIDGNRIKLKMSQLTDGSERYLIVELDAERNPTEAPERIAKVGVSYIDLDQGARQKASLDVEASRSADARKIEAGIDATIMAKVTEQRANIVTEEAVELRDKGDLAGAKRLLEQNAVSIDEARQRFSGLGASSASVQRLEALKKQSEVAAGSLDDGDWAKTRKDMRYQQHKAKRQQTY